MKDLERQGSVGILPVGALGVGFFFHLTRELAELDRPVRFVQRSGSTHALANSAGGVLRIASKDGVRDISVAQVCRPDLLGCAQSEDLPEIVLVCTQSDQVLPVISHYVEVLEVLFRSTDLDTAVARLPVLILCSNGIYYQRVRQYLVEALEEATLYGRLPDLWSEPMARIVAKLLRGVTIQTGQREGDGPEAVYRPGPLGRTRLAGGALEVRQRCGHTLQQLGGWFEVVETHTPTRVEFDKALINLFGNLLGQFKAIDEHGAFHLVTVGDIIPEVGNAETREMAHHVLAVGHAVHAYRAEDDFETLYRAAIAATRGLLGHVPSSIKWIEAQLHAGTLKAKITPTEKWLLEPLQRYASTAGLDDSAHYFADVIRRAEERLGLAIAARTREHAQPR